MSESDAIPDLPPGGEIAFDGSGVEKSWVMDDPSKVHLAGRKPDLRFEKCRIYLGDHPAVFDFQRLAIESLEARLQNPGAAPQAEGPDGDDRERLEGVRKLRPYWNYYLILYGLGIDRCDSRLREVGLKLAYEDTKKTPVTILDYWPKSESKEVVRVGGRVRTNIDLHGKISTSLSDLVPVLKAIPLPFGAEIKLGGSGDLVAQFSFDLSIPIVEAFGAYSSCSMWTFHRTQNQQVLGHLVHTQAGVSSLRVTATVSAIYGGFFQTRASEEKRVRLQPVRLTDDD